MRITPPALTAALAAALSGCLATQRNMLELSQRSDAITLNVHQLRKQMTTLQANEADLNAKLDQLNRETGILNETLKDLQQSLTRVSAKLDDVGSGIGQQVAGVAKDIDASRRETLAREKQLRAEAEADRTRAQTVAQKLEEENKKLADALKSPGPSEVYYTANLQLNQKKYDLAAQGFAVYLEKWPSGEYADLATYGLGQARFALEKYEEAARQFGTVIDRFPKSEVTASARLRYAHCLLELKRNLDEAEAYLASIPQDFPGTPEARKAAELLQSLKGKKPKPAAPKSASTRKEPSAERKQ